MTLYGEAVIYAKLSAYFHIISIYTQRSLKNNAGEVIEQNRQTAT